MDFHHIPVLLSETVDGLNIKENGIYLDGTAGKGGHSRAIAKRLNGGKLICLDRDPDAVKAAKENLKNLPAEVFEENFSNLDKLLEKSHIKKLDGVLLDLGVSSYQLDTPARGFSYRADCPLDMRMSKEGISAADILNQYSEKELARILFEYGDEKFAGSIAKNIVRRRQEKPFKTAFELTELIRKSMPAKAVREKNPSKKTFQALRIEVNGEITNLQTGLCKAFSALKPGGRLAVITFHSLEDRTVKNFFRKQTQGCTCPKDFPVCVCGKTPKGKVITKKGILPTEDEIKANKRSKSAKLRIIEKIKD